MIWVLGCAAAPPPAELPRSPEAAHARLVARGWDARCEGGVLGDEVSYACVATGPGGVLEVDAVTTGAPLPDPAEGAGALVDGLWIEARARPAPGAPVDAEASRRALRAWTMLAAW